MRAGMGDWWYRETCRMLEVLAQGSPQKAGCCIMLLK